MQSPPFSRYLVPPRSKYSPQHLVLKHPQLPFLPQCQDERITIWKYGLCVRFLWRYGSPFRGRTPAKFSELQNRVPNIGYYRWQDNAILVHFPALAYNIVRLEQRSPRASTRRNANFFFNVPKQQNGEHCMYRAWKRMVDRMSTATGEVLLCCILYAADRIKIQRAESAINDERCSQSSGEVRCDWRWDFRKLTSTVNFMKWDLHVTFIR